MLEFFQFIHHPHIFLGEMSAQFLPIFIGLFVYLLLNSESFLHILMQVLYQIYDFKVFSPRLWFIFHSLNSVF